MSALGKRNAFGVYTRISRFFEANPDEELTIKQAAEKFEVCESAIVMASRELEKDGKLERVRIMRLPAKGRA